MTATKTYITKTYKQAIRDFQPKVKFRSLFGATDTVSDEDKSHVDKFGEIYVLGTSGEFRLVYNGSHWAEIL